MKEILKTIVFALTAAYVALLPNFFTIYSAEGRAYPLWDFDYYAAILSAIAVVAVVYGVAYALIYLVWKPGPLLKFARDALLVFVLSFLLTRTVVSILDRSGHTTAGYWSWLNTTPAKILYYFIMPLPLIAFQLSLARRAIRRVYALLAPLLVIIVVVPLTYATFDEYEEPLPDYPTGDEQVSNPAGDASVYIFLFDEWSYDRTFPGGRLREDLPNLRKLLDTSTSYERAFSAGSRTLVSIPRFLFQTDADLQKMTYGEVIAFACGKGRPRPSLFTLAPSNWFKAAIGFYVNYPALLAHQVDYCACLDNRAPWRTYGQSLFNLLDSQLAWARIFGFQVQMRTTTPITFSIYAERKTEHDARFLIRDTRGHSMAFFHFCLPHAPYVWNAHGLKNPMPLNVAEHSENNYLDNLRRMDTQLGSFVYDLKSSGKWDSSLVIFASDHSWRWDPAHPGFDARHEDYYGHNDWRHVPLIIHEPGQSEARIDKEEISTKDLHRLIRPFIQKVEQPST